MQSKGSQIEYQHCLQFFYVVPHSFDSNSSNPVAGRDFLRIFYRKKTLWFFKIKGVWIALQAELKTSDESLIWEVLKDVYLAMSHARFKKTHNSFQILHCCVYDVALQLYYGTSVTTTGASSTVSICRTPLMHWPPLSQIGEPGSQ